MENKDYMQMLIEGAEMNETQKKLYEDYVKSHNLNKKGERYNRRKKSIYMQKGKPGAWTLEEGKAEYQNT